MSSKFEKKGFYFSLKFAKFTKRGVFTQLLNIVFSIQNGVVGGAAVLESRASTSSTYLSVGGQVKHIPLCSNRVLILFISHIFTS